MSDPIEKLEKTCSILGNDCVELVKQRKSKQIGDLRFVNEYFTLLEKMPEGQKRESILVDLESYIKKNNRLENTEWLK